MKRAPKELLDALREIAERNSGLYVENGAQELLALLEEWAPERTNHTIVVGPADHIEQLIRDRDEWKKRAEKAEKARFERRLGDRRMTVDEALATAELDQYAADPVVGTLASEIERLRAENLLLATANADRDEWKKRALEAEAQLRAYKRDVIDF